MDYRRIESSILKKLKRFCPINLRLADKAISCPPDQAESSTVLTTTLSTFELTELAAFAFAFAQDDVLQLILPFDMLELLVALACVGLEWTLESTVRCFAARKVAVLPSLGFIVPAVLWILTLSSVDLQLVGLDCELVLVGVRILFWIEVLGQLLRDLTFSTFILCNLP